MNQIELRILKQNIGITLSEFYMDILQKDGYVTMEEYEKIRKKHINKFIEDAERLIKNL